MRAQVPLDTRDWKSAGMPIPLSFTSRRTNSESSASASSARIFTQRSPFRRSEYLMALSTRLVSTSCATTVSTSSRGTLGSNSRVTSWDVARAISSSRTNSITVGSGLMRDTVCALSTIARRSMSYSRPSACFTPERMMASCWVRFPSSAK
jgi:hypothetical protein